MGQGHKSDRTTGPRTLRAGRIESRRKDLKPTGAASLRCKTESIMLKKLKGLASSSWNVGIPGSHLSAGPMPPSGKTVGEYNLSEWLSLTPVHRPGSSKKGLGRHTSVSAACKLTPGFKRLTCLRFLPLLCPSSFCARASPSPPWHPRPLWKLNCWSNAIWSPDSRCPWGMLCCQLSKLTMPVWHGVWCQFFGDANLSQVGVDHPRQQPPELAASLVDGDLLHHHQTAGKKSYRANSSWWL